MILGAVLARQCGSHLDCRAAPKATEERGCTCHTLRNKQFATHLLEQGRALCARSELVLLGLPRSVPGGIRRSRAPSACSGGRRHLPRPRAANRGHLSPTQLKVISAIWRWKGSSALATASARPCGATAPARVSQTCSPWPLP